MVDLNPYEPGDDIFQQFDLTQTLPVASAVEIKKGNIYTMNANGYIAALTAASAVADCTSGYYQAKADSKDQSASGTTETAGTRAVQFLVPGAWIILKAPADTTPGDKADVAATGTTVTADTIQVNAASGYTKGYLGRVYQILSKNTGSTETTAKVKTAANDLVVIHGGIA